MQRPPQPAFAASPTPIPPVTPRSPSARPPLPDRNVTSATIEDAYVGFILCCNPAVPLETDTAALREAFQTPPKSGGKTFKTYTLFELIKRLESKELKTWAELALKLGVEPPDQEKGESSQKIQQYAVRLKRWMHSMHVDAFFEYLINRPNSYWTNIPSDASPITELGRDGVAAEDDMALRALLPHIRPRRGRRRPEEDDSARSPSQRPVAGDEEYGVARPEGMTPWSAHPDGREHAFLFPVSDTFRLGAGTAQPSGPPWSSLDVGQTPFTPYPHSAITPSTGTGHGFWADEPKSAVTPSKPRSMNKRHGAKVVSSAWRSGLGGTGKTRGRPPLHKGGSNNSDGPFSAFPSSDLPSFKVPYPAEKGARRQNSPSGQPPLSAPSLSSPAARTTATGAPTAAAPFPPPSHPQSPHPSATTATPPHTTSAFAHSPPDQDAASSRPAKRSRLSLQVPARVGGEVRLATPPPVVTVNGQAAPAIDGDAPPPPPPPPPPPTAVPPHGGGSERPGPPSMLNPTVGGSSGSAGSSADEPPRFPPASASAAPGAGGMTAHMEVRFEDPLDNTNRNELEAFFVHEILSANWNDAEGNRIPACGTDEAYAIVEAVVESLRKAAVTKDGFLINLAALAGGKMLMSSTNLDISRLEELADRTRYSCTWELRLGDIRGIYSMHETVMHSRWKDKTLQRDVHSSTAATPSHSTSSSTVASAAATAETDAPPGGEGSMEHWQKKYREMCDVVRAKDRQLSSIRLRVLDSLRERRTES